MKSDANWTVPTIIPHNQPILLLAHSEGNGPKLQEYLTEQGFDIAVIWLDKDQSWPPHALNRELGAVILEQGPTLERSWDALKALRENPLTKDTPILIYSLDENQNSGSVLEWNYLTKPLNQAELIKALERQQPNKVAKTILIIDDEPSTVELHTQMVRAWSPTCRVLKARNGREALDIIHEAHPDLILLDLMMPELNGFGVLKAMRNDAQTRDIPVIVLTGQTLTIEDMSNLGKGVSSILTKCLFSAEETLSHIEAALHRNASLGDEARRAVRKAMTYIHQYYMDSISLEDTAQHVNMSKEYLARCFRQEMGITLVTYLNRYRINQAKKLLEQGERNLTAIALETGFSSSGYFSRVFRQEVGMSPSDYIKVETS